MYRDLEDNEILYMIKENNENYIYLCEKYKPLLFKICKPYIEEAKEMGFELDDLMQIAYIGLIDAVKSYKDNQKTLFYTYMVKCVRNRLYNEIRNQTSNKKLALNTAISYEELIPGTKKTLIEVLPNVKSPNPFDFLLEEFLEKQYKEILNSLPFDVALVYEMKQEGLNDNQISVFVRINKSDIPRYLKQARNKFNIAKRKLAYY